MNCGFIIRTAYLPPTYVVQVMFSSFLCVCMCVCVYVSVCLCVCLSVLVVTFEAFDIEVFGMGVHLDHI